MPSTLVNPPLQILKSHICQLRPHAPIRIQSNTKVHSKSITMAIRSEMDDGYYMRRCVELARTAIGHTAPNPMVGCVIVDGKGEIVGEGFHPKAGQPHAEVFALRNAGSLAENATAYVSLEPCNHYGRTPPCTEALIKAKVKRVVVGMVDPNPIVASKGVEKLRASGIDVTVGIEERLCQKLNEAYIHRMLIGKPFVTLRYTISSEGKIVNQLGEGSDEPGGYYSQLLQEYDGIISFSPELSVPTSQEPGASQPAQIILAKIGSSSLSLPNSYANTSSRVIIFAGKPLSVEPKFEGLEAVVLEKMSLSSILDYCGKQGLCSILIDVKEEDDGVFELLDEGFSENLVQKVVIEMSSAFGRSERFADLKFGRNSLRLKDLKSKVSNNSVIVEGYIS